MPRFSFGASVFTCFFMFKIHKGLDIPISNSPDQILSEKNLKVVTQVALLGSDYHGMKPSMQVKVGDQVKLGQSLFIDKNNPKVNFTAPAGGEVVAINRGAKRVLESVVIAIAANEEKKDFEKLSVDASLALSRDDFKAYLAETGLWTAFRTRPYSKIPLIDTAPDAIFVTAIDTQPLSLDVSSVIHRHKEAFLLGLKLLTKLTQGKVFVCHDAKDNLSEISEHAQYKQIEYHGFSGKHPAGLVGTHIHLLNPASRDRVVWHLHAEDVIAIAETLLSGNLFTQRYISIAGPLAKKPRVLISRIGAAISDLTQDEITDEAIDPQADQGKSARIISGSVLCGHDAHKSFAYLGRYHHQISILGLGDNREFMGWLSPGINKFSVLNIYLSRWFKGKKFAFTSTTNGSERAMLPIGSYEAVMPLDILPTQLLRSIIVGDIEAAEKLGMLELDEEDLALCTFVCPGKYEFGSILRNNLTRFEKEV